MDNGVPNIILFSSDDQFLLTPAIGFVLRHNYVLLNITWLHIGINIRLFKYV